MLVPITQGLGGGRQGNAKQEVALTQGSVQTKSSQVVAAEHPPDAGPSERRAAGSASWRW